MTETSTGGKKGKGTHEHTLTAREKNMQKKTIRHTNSKTYRQTVAWHRQYSNPKSLLLKESTTGGPKHADRHTQRHSRKTIHTGRQSEGTRNSETLKVIPSP